MCLSGSQSHLLCLRANRQWENLHDEWRCGKWMSWNVLFGCIRYIRLKGFSVQEPDCQYFVLWNLLRKVVWFAQQSGTSSSTRRRQVKRQHHWFDCQANQWHRRIHGNSHPWQFCQDYITKQYQFRFFSISRDPSNFLNERKENLWKNFFHWFGRVWKRSWYPWSKQANKNWWSINK